MNGIRRFNPTQLFNDGLLGQYSLGTFSGVIGAGVTGDIFQFRWQDSLRLAAIRRVLLTVVSSTPFGAAPATSAQFNLYYATGWSAPGTGGFAVNPLATNKRRSQMPASLVVAGDIRIANATALGAGTKVFADPPLAGVAGVLVSANTCPVVAPTELLSFEASGLDYPLVLAQNEGFTINLITNPGTGTMIASVSVDWLECNAS